VELCVRKKLYKKCHSKSRRWLSGLSVSDISNESTAEQILIRFLVTETVTLNIMCSFRRNQGDPLVEVEASPDSYHRNPVHQKSSAYTAKKLLHLQPYKFKIVQKLHQADCISRTHFYNCFCEAGCNDEVAPELTYLTYEAGSLNDKINSGRYFWPNSCITF
jgi:hypothetical protein